MGTLPTIRFGGLLILLAVMSLEVQAAQEAAKVIMVKGSAQATDADGRQRSLARRSLIYVGDTLSTDDGSMLQLRFTDKALMTLRENTQFQIQEYVAGDGDKGGAAIMQLLAGGFRTITGTIGKGNSDSYKVSTGAASIGIRGTHYEALEIKDQKLLVAVWGGGIRLENNAGVLELGQDVAFRYSEVAPGKAPIGLLNPPAPLQQGLPLPVSRTKRSPNNATADNESSSDAGDNNTNPPEDQQAVAEATAEEHPFMAAEGDMELTHLEGDDIDTALAGNAPLTVELSEPLDFLTQDQNLDFTQTNPELTDTLTTPPNPYTTPATQDPRLTIDEFNQIGSTSILGTGVMRGPGVEILATIIAQNAITPFNYATAGTAKFTIDYYYNVPNSTPPIYSVNISLNNNITDLNSLIADIQDELGPSGAPIGVRESMLHPGKLEFYNTTNDTSVQFGLVAYDTTSSTALPSDLQATLGDIADGTHGFGGIDSPQPGNFKAVFNADGELVVIKKDDLQDTTDPGPMPAPDVFVNPNDLTPYDVARQGEATMTDYNPAVGGRSNISWGAWNASTSNPVYIYEDPSHPSVFKKEDESIYWLTAEAANATSLTGTATFDATPDFIGSGSDGAVTNVFGSFDVNFDSGVVNNGALHVTTTNQDWQVQMSGIYKASQASLSVDDGFISGSINCSNCVNGNLTGIFVAPGDAFAGGFDLQKSDDHQTHVEGLILMEKQ